MIYAAFLRAINVGSRNIKMDELLRAFEQLGFAGAKSVLASGNVIFESAATPDIKALEGGLEEIFSINIAVVVRSLAELEALDQQNPFSNYQANKESKFYISMASGAIGNRLDGVTGIAGDYDLVRIDEKDYFCVAFRQQNGRFGPGLDRLEKFFKDLAITTRNWNTIARIIKKASQ